MLAAQAIQCGDASVVVAGGTENMSRAPYLLDKARTGYRMGNGELVDAMIRDGLWDVYNNVHMGTCGDRCAEKYGFTPPSSRTTSPWPAFKRALDASGTRGIFAREIEPVQVKAGRETVTVAEDETPKQVQRGEAAQASPRFRGEGHDHRRQCLQHQRWRGGGRGGFRRKGQEPGPQAAGQNPGLCHLLA